MPWAFADPSNLAVMTTRQVVNEVKFINFVSHDEDDGGWQFHHATSSAPDINDAFVVGLSEIVALDQSVEELVDLPLGWKAYRESKDLPWTRVCR